MNKLILVRHGQSTGNVDEKMYYYPDSVVCLTELGVRQAIECGNTLKSMNFKWGLGHNFQAFSSQYTRAKQTGRIVLDIMGFPGKEIIPVAGLNEMSHGDGHEIAPPKNDPYIAPRNGENMIMVRERLGFWFDHNISYLLTESDVILFMHYGSLRGLASHILKLSDNDMMNINVRNAVPYVYERQNQIWQQTH
jgi:bisphosphoglycerate-dependent phosphoglycerate mutase